MEKNKKSCKFCGKMLKVQPKVLTIKKRNGSTEKFCSERCVIDEIIKRDERFNNDNIFEVLDEIFLAIEEADRNEATRLTGLLMDLMKELEPEDQGPTYECQLCLEFLYEKEKAIDHLITDHYDEVRDSFFDEAPDNQEREEIYKIYIEKYAEYIE